MPALRTRIRIDNPEMIGAREISRSLILFIREPNKADTDISNERNLADV